MMYHLLVVALLVVVACTEKPHDNSLSFLENESCDTMFCALGKECVMKDNIAVCECIEICEDPQKPVCGSNGVNLTTYESECHLFKEACEQENSTLTLVAESSCEKVQSKDWELSKKIEADVKKVKPVVCLEKDRDNIRKAIINWISHESTINVTNHPYKEILLTYFNSLDADNDSALDTGEFMKLLDKDKSLTEELNQDKHKNPILRGLCSTELIAITDVNSDYKLEFDEFRKCLDPTFKPPKEKCELKGSQFEDGEDVPAECDNTCKCACGHWVCTYLPCENKTDGNIVVDSFAEDEI